MDAIRLSLAANVLPVHNTFASRTVAMRYLLCSVVVLLFLQGSSATHAADPLFPTVSVFRAGSEGYNVYRIPAVIRAANGDVLAFCEARSGGDASEIDLVMKRSTDQGKTWGPLKIVQESDNFRHLYGENPPPITVGNPAPVVDRLSKTHAGRIWLPFTVENDRVFVTSSDDHGRTWQKPREITSAVKKEAWGWYATGPVHSIQLQNGPHKGRLIIPADHRLGSDGKDRGPNGAQLFYSDDHGRTWILGAVDETYQDGLNANETTLVELADGRVYINTRDQNGLAAGTRGEAISTDGGASFSPVTPGRYQKFSPAPSVLDPPVVQCALLRLSNKLIVFSGPDENGPTGKGRSDLRLRISEDQTQSWRDGPFVHIGPAAYSDLVELENQQLGVLFEAGDLKSRNAYQRIDFARVPFKKLRNP